MMTLNNILSGIKDILLIFCLLIFISFCFDEEIKTEEKYNIAKISKIFDIIIKNQEKNEKPEPTEIKE